MKASFVPNIGLSGYSTQLVFIKAPTQSVAILVERFYQIHKA